LPNALKISIVDDDDLVRDALEDLLRFLGYENLAVFACAEDFLRSDSVLKTSCLIVDLQMPGMSGFDLQKRLIADGLHIPIIFISGASEEQVGADAMQAGAIGFLKKPVDVDYLIQCLNGIVKAGSKLNNSL